MVYKCYKRKNKILEVMREGGASGLLNSHPVSLNKNDVKVLKKLREFVFHILKERMLQVEGPASEVL